MINFEVEGIENLTRFATRIETMLSPAEIEIRVLAMAEKAGKALLAGSVRACIEAIYDNPELTYERTNSLLDAHQLINEGMTQIVQIDPDAVPASDSRSLNEAEFRERYVTAGREHVLDYAIPVHEGYTQWIFGRNTGEFHPGKFWFDVTVEEVGPVIADFIGKAFTDAIMEIMEQVAA